MGGGSNMLSQFPPDIQGFIGEFFGEGNDLKLDKIMQGDDNGSLAIRQWIEPLKSKSPTILPRRKGSRPVLWYGIAFSQSQFNRLWAEANSFVGVSYSNFRPGKAKLDLADPVDVAVQNITGGYTFTFFGNNNGTWKALQMLKKIKERSPALTREQPRVTGRVLRDFYMALQAGQRDAAEDCLRYLKDNHHLDPLNLTFLRVQLYTELGRWTELLYLPQMPELIKIRRPLAVTRALIKAVYIEELSQFERDCRPIEGVEHFKNQVFPLYSGLFTARSGLKEPEILKSFMMLAVMDIAPKPELRNEILEIQGLSPIDYDYLNQLANLFPLPQPTIIGDDLDHINGLILMGNYDEALKQAEKLLPSIPRARIILECAYEIQSLTAEREALKAVKDLTPEEIHSFMESRRNREFLESIGGKGVNNSVFALDEILPTDWISFINRINKGLFTPVRALTIAQNAVLEWDPESLKANPKDVERLIDLLNESRPASEEESLTNILPYLLNFFIQDSSWPRIEFKQVYLTLLFLLVLGNEGGESELEVFNEVVVGLLKLGVNKTEYEEILVDIQNIWDQFYSESTLTWALDIMDSLITYPCAFEDRRVDFLKSIINRLGSFSRRVKAEQWQLLRALLEDLNQFSDYESLLESIAVQRVELENQTEELLTSLNEKTIGIYTLDEPVATRVKQLLQEKCPEVRVQTSSDKVGNDKLKQLSRNADVFVIASGCAKHAATIFIESNRPKQLPTLWAKGKGSASMLRAIYDYIRSA